MSEVRGIDISSWQSDLTEASLLADVKFAILKICEGTTLKDKSFDEHYAMCTMANLPIGAYVYSHATTADGGRAEATRALTVLGNRKLTLPIFIDIEGDILDAGKDSLMASAVAFGKTIIAAGLRWGVYASLSRFGALLDVNKLREAGASIWCAAYNNVGPGMECDIWQHSDSWVLKNYSGAIDSNILYNTALLVGGGDGMNVKEKAVTWALDIADNPAHGYDQTSRWGPNYDCSSYLISAWEAAGVPVKSKGATYTGNMRKVFKACGFTEVTDGSRQRGDVLLNETNHTAMYIGDNKVVQASINEKGTIIGGVSGDQSGREIYVRDYYNYPWDCVLRYTGAGYFGVYEGDEVTYVTASPSTNTAATCRVTLPELSLGSSGAAVWSMQTLLVARKFSCGGDGADGDFGPATRQAVKNYQSENGLTADGICGEMSWAQLIGGNR